jgi:hypothetical protein
MLTSVALRRSEGETVMSQVTPPPVRLVLARSGYRLGPVPVVLGVLAILFVAALLSLDWSQGLAMALGALAGMFAPVVLIGLLIWGVYVACKQSGRIRS